MTRSISDCFKVLVDRIGRMTPMKFVELGFIPEGRLSYYFPDKDYNSSLLFDYLYVLTSEGSHGVLHVLFFGDYLNESWLKDSWESITGGARQLFIENIDVVGDGVATVSRYIVNQNKIFTYVSGQSMYVRHAYSGGWIYRGWRSDFERLRFIYWRREYYPKFDFSVSFWDCWFNWLTRKSMPQYVSMSLDDFLDISA
jgi:hypothetical protein